MAEITWSCMVCGRERPDESISVYSETHFMGRVPLTYNVRYCNDREHCSENAPKVVEDWAGKAER